MHADRWERIEQLLDAALDLPAEERRAFLDRECPDDPALRAEVDRILRAGEEPALLDRPAARVAEVVSEVPGDAPVPMPERVGPYRIERVIGEGGMGMVFLAHRDDGHFDQRVALKLVRRGLHLDTRVVRRFREERQILASLNHPGIARLQDGGIAEDGLPYFAMEYVEGEAITRYCDRHALGLEERLMLLVLVCDALAHAHAKQIVHRDVKPSNILVTADGHPRLLDFGIAKLLAPDEGAPGTALTRRSERLLTPEYASPEQIRGEPVGIAADVYGLGVLLYELLTGQRPFRRAERTARELENAVLEEDPTRPSEAARGEPLRRRLRGDLDAIVLTAMNKEPDRRYPGAAELAADVRRHLAGQPVTARSASPVYLVRRWVRRHRIAVRSAAAGAVLTAIAVTMVARGFAPDPILRSMRVSSPQQITNDEGLELDPAISPDGRQIAYAGGVEGAMRIFVRPRDGSRAVEVSGPLGGGNHRRPRWSPDGASLLFQAARGIWLVPVQGGAPRLVVEMPEDTTSAHSHTLSPDGMEVAWVARDTVFLRAFAGGQARMLATLPVAHSLAWSPDGRWIAMVSGNSEFAYHRLGNLGPSALYLVPTRCRDGPACAPVLLAPPTSLNTSPAWLDASRLVFVSSRGAARDLFAVRVGTAGAAAGEPVPLSAGQQLHAVSVAADGRTLAYGHFRQNTNIWSLDISSGRPGRLADATRVTSGQQTIEGVALSPDGQWLAFDANRAGQQDIYVVPVAGGEPERVVATPEDDFHPSWSPDGQSLAFYTFRDGVRRAATVPAHGGPLRLVHPTGPAREEHSPIWTADGQGLVYWRSILDSFDLYAVWRTGESTWSAERQLTRRGGAWPSFSADGRLMAYLAPPGVVRVMGPDLDEDTSRLVDFSPIPETGVFRFQNGILTPDGTAYIVKGEDGLGPGFWRMPIAGGPAQLVLRLDDPRRTSPRPEFATDGRRLFFLLTERDADVWAVRLEAR